MTDAAEFQIEFVHQRIFYRVYCEKLSETRCCFRQGLTKVGSAEWLSFFEICCFLLIFILLVLYKESLVRSPKA